MMLNPTTFFSRLSCIRHGEADAEENDGDDRKPFSIKIVSITVLLL